MRQAHLLYILTFTHFLCRQAHSAESNRRHPLLSAVILFRSCCTSYRVIIPISFRAARTRQQITDVVLPEELRFDHNVALLVEVHTNNNIYTSTTLLLLSCISPTALLQLSYSSPTALLQLSYSSPTTLLHLSYSFPTALLHLSYSSPASLLQLSYSSPAALLHVSYSSLQLLYSSHTALLQLSCSSPGSLPATWTWCSDLNLV